MKTTLGQGLLVGLRASLVGFVILTKGFSKFIKLKKKTIYLIRMAN